jgi:ribosomal protein L11 methylase PrmA
VIERSLAADGVAILSGILADERAGMYAVISAGGWRVLAEDLEEQWWSVSVHR